MDEVIAQEKNALVTLRVDLSVLKGEPALTNDWLNLYGAPTVDAEGYVVEAHPDGNKYDWAMPEELSGGVPRGELTSNVLRTIEDAGGIAVVNILDNNLYTDAEGRYWVAVGPNVMNPDHQPNESVSEEEMQFGTKIDIVVLDESTNTEYYIPAVVGDVKNHTYPNGIYHTGVPFPCEDMDYAEPDGSTVEFMGWNVNDSDIVHAGDDFRILRIIVYEGEVNY